MNRFESVSDMRRKAPFHFLARANNAKDCAYYIWQAPNGNIALQEGFCREAGVALELIIKAMICQNIEAGREKNARPPGSHDLPKLWSQAKLPKLSKAGQLTLLEFARVLKWAGRYPAPLDDDEYADYAEREDELLDDTSMVGTLRIRRMLPLTWERFLEVFEIAHSAFWSQRYLDRPWERDHGANEPQLPDGG